MTIKIVMQMKFSYFVCFLSLEPQVKSTNASREGKAINFSEEVPTPAVTSPKSMNEILT